MKEVRSTDDNRLSSGKQEPVLVLTDENGDRVRGEEFTTKEGITLYRVRLTGRERPRDEAKRKVE